MRLDRGRATPAVIVAVALTVVLAGGVASAQRMGRGFGLARLEGTAGGGIARLYKAALARLDLSQDQQDRIKALVDSEGPVLTALMQQRKNDAEALKAAADATPPDPTTVGTAFLKAQADGQAVRAEVGKLHDSIEALLTPEQKAAFEAYLDAFRSGLRHGRGPNG